MSLRPTTVAIGSRPVTIFLRFAGLILKQRSCSSKPVLEREAVRRSPKLGLAELAPTSKHAYGRTTPREVRPEQVDVRDEEKYEAEYRNNKQSQMPERVPVDTSLRSEPGLAVRLPSSRSATT
jgi:hypothetical protein